MKNNRLLKVVAVVVMLMAVAASGVAAASAPTGRERSVASSPCQATLRKELGTVMPSGLSGYQESNCSTGDQAAPAPVTGRGPYASLQAAGLSTLDNPHNQWIGPETVSAALGQVAAVSPLDNSNSQWIGPETVSAALGQPSGSFPTTGGSGDLTSGAATRRDAVASGRGPYASPQTAPAPAIGRGPYASLQAALVSTRLQESYGPPGR